MDDQEKQINNEGVTEEQTSTYTEPVEEKSTGAIIGVIIIVVLLVIGGLYYLGSRSGNEQISDETAPAAEEILSETDSITAAIEAQDTSDEIDAIQKDIDDTDLGNIDIDLGNIEAELGL